MNRARTALAAMALGLILQARADFVYTFEMVEGGNPIARGTVSSLDNLTATGGFLEILPAAAGYGVPTGVFPWLATPTHFVTDNLLMPGNGLNFSLLGLGYGDATGMEVIIRASGIPSTPYALAWSNGTESNTILGFDSLAPTVPEPSTILAAALLIVPFGMSALRVLRKDHQA